MCYETLLVNNFSKKEHIAENIPMAAPIIVVCFID